MREQAEAGQKTGRDDRGVSAEPWRCSRSSLPDLTARAVLRPSLFLAGTVLLATLVKIAFMTHLDGQMYGDIRRALDFGFLVAEGPDSIRTTFINDKTFIGPLFWYALYRQMGVGGLLAVNVFTFLALCTALYRLGYGRYQGSVRIVAMLLFAFYVGTHRNIAAGESDDNLAALLFAVGILAYLDRRRSLIAGLLVGVAFLFKFWIPIFAIGLLVFMAHKRRWRDLGLSLAGMVLPFVAINVVDGGASLRCLWFSIQLQHAYSSWPSMAFKLFSTGLLPIAVFATLVWWKRRSDVETLFWLLAVAYPAYALVNRDVFAASFVLMLSMLFASFPLAEGLLAAVARLQPRWRPAVLAGTLGLYLAGTTMITYHNFQRDTTPIVLSEDAEQARRVSGAQSVVRPR